MKTRRRRPVRDDHPSDAPHLQCPYTHGPGVRAHCRCGATWPCPYQPESTQ